MASDGEGESSDGKSQSTGENRRLVSSSGETSSLPAPPFQDLVAPAPRPADPSALARWGAFVAIAVGGVLGMLIGYGIGDLMASAAIWSAVGAVIGAVTAAVGVGVVANLALRAMGEWREVEHLEDHPPSQTSVTPAKEQ